MLQMDLPPASKSIPRIGVEEWAPPILLDLGVPADQKILADLAVGGRVTRIIDPVDILAGSMYQMNHPWLPVDESHRRNYVEQIVSKGDSFGTWVYYNWSGIVQRFTDIDTHRQLLRSRDRDLVTSDQSELLAKKRIVFVGLSVGSKALESVAEAGIGSDYILSDGDYVDPRNLNRLGFPFSSVGQSKTSEAAKRVSERDPWVRMQLIGRFCQDHVPLLEGADLIVEEVDDMRTKALLRVAAHDFRIPLVMAADVHNRSVVDIERHDLRDRSNITFSGRIALESARSLAEGGELSPAENRRWMLAHAGTRNLTTQMMRSVMQVGSRLDGMPQLGMTATRGGANIALVAREILLGKEVRSGRYADSPDKTFKVPSGSTVSDYVSTLFALRKFVRKGSPQGS